MKSILSFLFAVLAMQFVNAQSVGIGTTTPHAKAALEINSTTKGLLVPSMTSVQRSFILSPPNGLMVYDTDVNQFYHYDGTTWRKIINSTYWNQSNTRNWVYNSTDSVGIGTSIPAQRLDVNGNIRSRDDVLADNNITATGTVSGGLLSSTGNLVTVGTSLLNGDVTTNSDVILNNNIATLQLRSGGVNKGFFQLSGYNVRLGTNSGNSTGDLIIRMNGNDRITINPSGDVDLDGKITRTAVTGGNNLLPLCYGAVNSNGTVKSGTGNFSVTKISTGEYRISCSGITNNSVISISTRLAGVTGHYTFSVGEVVIYIWDNLISNVIDHEFNFIIYK